MTPDDLLRSSEEAFRHSNNYAFQHLAGEEDKETATYRSDSIFIGWSVFSSETYNNLVGKVYNQGGKAIASRNDARQLVRDNYMEEFFGEEEEKIFLDRDEPNIVFIAGQRGSGKSFLLRSISNRESKAGTNTVLMDIAGEYYTNNQYHGIQSDLANLRDGEKAQKIKTKVLTPLYVKRAREEQDLSFHGTTESWHDFFQFDFSDLDAADIQYLFMEMVSDTKAAKNDARIIGMEISRRMRDHDWTPYNWNDVLDVCYDLADGETKSGASLSWGDKRIEQQVKPMITTNYKPWGILGNRADPVDWEQVFDKYNCIALNLDDNSFFDQVDFQPLYISLLIKKVRKLKRQNRIDGDVDILGDEWHKQVPRGVDDGDNPAKKQWRQALKEDRKFGIHGTGASQEPTDVEDDDFLDQCSYFLIPWNMGQMKRRKLLRKSDAITGRDIQAGVMESVFRQMDKFQWLVVDNIKNRWDVVEVASPLANHRTSD